MLLTALFVFSACDIPPTYVTSADIDNSYAQQRWKTVCHGLDMKDDEVRRYTAQKLRTLDTEPIGQQCICDHKAGLDNTWDPALLKGLTGEDDDKYVSCVVDYLKATPTLNNRVEIVAALKKIPAPSSRQALLHFAQNDPEVEVRVAAVEAIGGDKSFQSEILALLADKEADVRAAAASGLYGMKDQAVIDALMTATKEDDDGLVRANAMLSLKKSGVEEADAMLCTAMMEDTSPQVRRRAILAFRGTKRKEAVECLRKRALAEEDDSGVRDAMLTVLKSSPSQDAADVLCDAIPYWMRTYVKEEIPEKIPGTLIVQAQNDRDWENSYKCVQKALSRGGYSCYARMHLGGWMRELGGNASVPRCPGYEDL